MKSDTSAAVLSADDFYLGILVALGIVYAAGAETVAEEIVGACGSRESLRVARREGDPCLSDLRKTIAVEFVAASDPQLAGAIPHMESLVRGAVIGTVRQVGCVTEHQSPFFCGKYGHMYDQALEFSVPILCRGYQGLWNWEPPSALSELWRPV